MAGGVSGAVSDPSCSQRSGAFLAPCLPGSMPSWHRAMDSRSCVPGFLPAMSGGCTALMIQAAGCRTRLHGAWWSSRPPAHRQTRTEVLLCGQFKSFNVNFRTHTPKHHHGHAVIVERFYTSNGRKTLHLYSIAWLNLSRRRLFLAHDLPYYSDRKSVV